MNENLTVSQMDNKILELMSCYRLCQEVGFLQNKERLVFSDAYINFCVLLSDLRPFTNNKIIKYFVDKCEQKLNEFDILFNNFTSEENEIESWSVDIVRKAAKNEAILLILEECSTLLENNLNEEIVGFYQRFTFYAVAYLGINFNTISEKFFDNKLPKLDVLDEKLKLRKSDEI